MVLGMEGTRMIKPALTGQEFNDLSVYLYFLKFFDGRGNPVRGKSVFTEKGCHLCHPFAGKGRQDELGFSESPQNISPIFLSKGIWNHSLEIMKAAKEEQLPWPLIGKREITDLVEYILAPQRVYRDTSNF